MEKEAGRHVSLESTRGGYLSGRSPSLVDCPSPASAGGLYGWLRGNDLPHMPSGRTHKLKVSLCIRRRPAYQGTVPELVRKKNTSGSYFNEGGRVGPVRSSYQSQSALSVPKPTTSGHAQHAQQTSSQERLDSVLTNDDTVVTCEPSLEVTGRRQDGDPGGSDQTSHLHNACTHPRIHPPRLSPAQTHSERAEKLTLLADAWTTLVVALRHFRLE